MSRLEFAAARRKCRALFICNLRILMSTYTSGGDILKVLIRQFLTTGPLGFRLGHQ